MEDRPRATTPGVPSARAGAQAVGAGDVARVDPGSRDAGARVPAPPWQGVALPGLCPACRRWPARAARGPGGLCDACGHATGVDAATLAAAADGRAFRRASAAVRYEAPWDGWVRQLKFADGLALARPMAALAAHAWRAGRGDGEPAPTIVVPVPLAPARLRERGYNQAWELARRIGRAIGVPAVPDALLRVRDTRAQAELGLLERRANLDGAFAAEPARRAALAGARVVLVDDVLTTGATLHAAAQALRDAGAADVQACTFALTPPPGTAPRA